MEILLLLILFVLVFGASKVMDGVIGCFTVILFLLLLGVLVKLGGNIFSLFSSIIGNPRTQLGLIILLIVAIFYLGIISLFKVLNKPVLNEDFLKAVNSGQTALALTLVNKKPNVNLYSESNYVIMSPLMIASDKGNLELVKELIKSKANVNARNPVNWTPLMFATRNGHIEVVRELIKSKAKINIKNKKNATAYTIAKSKDFDEIANLLNNIGAKKNR